jgi:glycosyltransferase involved in cell wall biosynthesis
MKLSILILTHNRPGLFIRAINSVLSILPEYDIEILVNNDTKDIEEVYHNNVCIKYYYEQKQDLSDIYKLLYDNATGEFIYFLEDDDYLKSNFFIGLDFKYDINYLEYMSEPLIQDIGPMCQFKRLTAANRHLLNTTQLSCFLDKYDDRDFQLGQIIFKKKLISIFPTGNYICNDIELFKGLAGLDITIKYLLGQRWVQTTDGGDNISFNNLNKDDRFR